MYSELVCSEVVEKWWGKLPFSGREGREVRKRWKNSLREGERKACGKRERKRRGKRGREGEIEERGGGRDNKESTKGRGDAERAKRWVQRRDKKKREKRGREKEGGKGSEVKM